MGCLHWAGERVSGRDACVWSRARGADGRSGDRTVGGRHDKCQASVNRSSALFGTAISTSEAASLGPTVMVDETAARRTNSASFEICTFESATELEQVWLDLERRARPPFFLSWDWIGCWVCEASLHPPILIGRAEGQVVLLGILTPSTRRVLRSITVDGLQLHMTGNPHQDVITIEYNGFLVDHDLVGKIEADAVAFLLGGIALDGHRREELHLKNIPAALERSVRASGFHFREVQRKPSWRVDLAAIRAAGKRHLDCLSANTRQQIRRSMRLYEKRGRSGTSHGRATCPRH